MKRIFVMLTVISGISFGFLLWDIFQSSSPFPSSCSFQVTYAAKLSNIPEGASEIHMWIPLASSGNGQRILERNIVSDAPFTLTQEPRYGNEMAYFEIESPLPQPLNVEVVYSVEIAQGLFAKDAEKYLQSSHLMLVDEMVRARTGEAVHGKKKLTDKARGIYEYVIDHMSYDKTVPGWGQGDTVRACLLGKGNCTDFHSLFISMAHAAEIPARFKIGLTIPRASEGEISGYHCWAEFYEDGRGWLPIDASEAWKNSKRKEVYFGNFDTNKFLISVGRDIELVPKQAGPPVNIFFYPYVEVDSKEWSGINTSFQFKNLPAGTQA